MSNGEAKPVALIDLGDTLCDCSTAIDARLPRSVDSLSSVARDLERRQLLFSEGFWRELPPLDLGFELLGVLRDAGFAVHVVSKGPRDATQVWADKAAWCRRYVPELPLIITDDKSLVHGALLADDWLPYLEQWQARWPRGLTIVVAQPWNSSAPLGPLRFRFDGHNRRELKQRLEQFHGTARD